MDNRQHPTTSRARIRAFTTPAGTTTLNLEAVRGHHPVSTTVDREKVEAGHHREGGDTPPEQS